MAPLLPPHPEGTVVTVGTFDGVHRGHLAVLEEITGRARAAGRKSVLVTFDPHPLEVVNPQAAPALLTTGPERREALALTGLDYAVFLRFDRALANYTPEQFVREVLIARCGMRELVIGHDHAFGRGRSGDVDTLRRLGARRRVRGGRGGSGGPGGPCDLQHRHPAGRGGRRPRARGTAARAAVHPERAGGAGRGAGPDARDPHDQRGVYPERKLLPPNGVYAARVEWAGGVAGGMLNQGPRPTFGEPRRSVEVHLLGWTPTCMASGCGWSGWNGCATSSDSARSRS